MRSNKIIGVCLILLAIVIAVLSVTVRNFTPFIPGWWAIFIIIGGISKLTERGERLFGLVLILGGAFIIANANMRLQMSYSSVLMVFGLVLVGLSLLSSDKRRESGEFHYNSTTDNNYTEFKDEQTSTGSQRFNNKQYQEVNVLLGSRLINLKDLNSDGDFNLYCKCILGDIKVYVPDNMNIVITKNNNVLGSIRDVRAHSKNTYDNTLYIQCNCVLGDISII